MSWSAPPDYYPHSLAYYAQTHTCTSQSIHQSSIPPSSWSAQPGIYIDAYRPHTHAYTQNLSPLPRSPYSSLTGALDLPSANGRTRSYSIHKARTSANAGYAYPVSQYDPPKSPTRPCTRSRAKSQNVNVLVECNGTPNRRSAGSNGHPTETIIKVMKPLCGIPGPTNHVILPQKVFNDLNVYIDPHFRHPPISFQTAGIPELGVRVGKIIEKHSPSLVGGNDRVFSVSDREIRIWILWPGYSAYPVQKRLKTQMGTITKDSVLSFVADMLVDYAYAIQRKGVPIERGYEDWTIGTRPDNKEGLISPVLFITRLHHRGGSVWQPEIWAPSRP